MSQSLYEHFKSHPIVCTDSRSITPGCIFIALKGPSFNGNTFAEKALQLGAALAVVDQEEFAKDERYLVVEDGLKSLQQLANDHRRHLRIPFLAITGSNGKTTTKELIRSVLSKKFRTLATKGNLNNHIGVPLTILSITPDIEFAVIEMGANHQQEIESYCTIAKPDYGIITNVGFAHLEGFGGFEGVKKGKGELYTWIAQHGKAIFLSDDSKDLNGMAAKHGVRDIVRYGTKPGLYCSGKLVSDAAGLEVEWKSNDHSGSLVSELTGAYNLENILCAVCVGNYFGVPAAAIDKAIGEYEPDNSRSQLVKRGSNTIVLDAYNANPTSMEAALTNFERIKAGKKIVCLGAMAELGEASTAEHVRIAAMVKRGKYDLVIFVGHDFKKASEGRGMFFDNSEMAAEWLKKHPVENSSILIKGSRTTKMERLLEAL